MNSLDRWMIPLLSLGMLAGCGATDAATHGGPDDSTTGDVSLSLVGSYPEKTGGSLDVYEAGEGEFVIGERLPAKRANDADGADSMGAIGDADSLPAIYLKMVGSTAVPSEIYEAEARRVAFVARASQEPAPVRSHSFDVTPVAAQVEQPVTDFQAKEAPRDVAGFRLYHCRETSGAVKSFTYCLTERTGDGSVLQRDAHGTYTAVRPYRGQIGFKVRYNLTSWSTALDVTVNEGETYRARMVGPVRDYDISSAVYNASGDGYNHAVIGTDKELDKHCYSDFNNIGCIAISGQPL